MLLEIKNPWIRKPLVILAVIYGPFYLVTVLFFAILIEFARAQRDFAVDLKEAFVRDFIGSLTQENMFKLVRNAWVGGDIVRAELERERKRQKFYDDHPEAD